MPAPLHSTYSFVLINVKLTVRLGIFYPAKKFWQDIEFNHMLEEEGLVVMKCRTFMHGTARTPSSTAPVAAPPLLQPVPARSCITPRARLPQPR